MSPYSPLSVKLGRKDHEGQAWLCWRNPRPIMGVGDQNPVLPM